jgi:putative transposase
MDSVKRGYTYRFYPTPEQETLLARTFGCVRKVYNTILDWRTKEFYEHQKKMDYLKANARLTDIKKRPEFGYLSDVSSVPLQQCLRHQQTAYKNFWAGKQSAEFTASAFKYVGGKLFVAKSKEPLDIRWSRELPSAPSTMSKDPAGSYFVSCLCEFVPERLKVTPNRVGVDLGIKDLFVTDQGKKTGNPRHAAKYATKLAKHQRRLAKKKLGSKNRIKAKQKVARIHAKISDCRMDNLHQLSRRLINENQVVCVESLKVKNMIRNPKLSKSIADAGWGRFVKMLGYKADWGGRTVVAINQFFPSSKRCSGCGHINDELTLDVRDMGMPVLRYRFG